MTVKDVLARFFDDLRAIKGSHEPTFSDYDRVYNQAITELDKLYLERALKCMPKYPMYYLGDKNLVCMKIKQNIEKEFGGKK